MLNYETHIKPYLIRHGNLPGASDLLPDGTPMLHPFYGDILAQVKEIDEVFAKAQPPFMDLNRPKESKAHKDYRKAIFKNTVKPFLGRVTRQYEQIRVVEDYEVEWPLSDSEILSGRNLRQLCESKRFSGDNVQDWFWSKWANAYLKDPNSAAVLLPPAQQSENQLRTFTAMWVSSAKIWQCRKGEFAVIESEEKNTIKDTYNNVLFEGKILYFFDRDSYFVAKQTAINSVQGTSNWEVSGSKTSVAEGGALVQIYTATPHNCEGLPLVFAGHTVGKVHEGGRYEMLASILEDALPHLKKALQRDEDGEIVALHHAVPREWEYAPSPCPTCQGTGKVDEYDEENKKTTTKCETCQGNGVQSTSNGLGVYQLRPPSVEGYDDQMKVVSLPTPPVGRLDGDTAAMEMFSKQFEQQVTLAYRALGMEHLNHVPLAQAGVAKRYDAKEGEMNLVTAGTHAGAKLSWIISCTGQLVYGTLGGVKEQLPTIRTPKRFEIEGIDTVGERLNQAIQNKYSPETIYTLQLEYLRSVAGENSDEFRMYQLRKRIDPYWFMGFEALNFEQAQIFNTMKRDGQAFQKKNQLIELSKNFEMLVQDAISQDENFWKKKPSEQRTLLMAANLEYVDVRTDNFEITPVAMQGMVSVQDTNQLKN